MKRGLAAKIEHQTQPTAVSCTATCVAMALGIQVEALGVPLENGLDFEDFGVFLAERGVWMRQGIVIDTKGERFQQGHVYLISVRSLNNLAADHVVLLDARGEPTNSNPRSGWIFYDPVQGMDGKKTYSWIDPGQVVDFVELRDRSTSGVITVGCPP